MIRIGKIVATHGLQGALIVTHLAGTSTWLKKEDALMVEMTKDSYIPFFVTTCKANNDEEYVVQLEEVNVVEEARKLIGRPVYVQEEMLAPYIEQTPLLWMGFKVVDKTKGEIGIVDDIYQTAAQWLAVVHINGAEVLLPLVEQTILQVNLKTKKIHMDIPAGLIEVYTENK